MGVCYKPKGDTLDEEEERWIVRSNTSLPIVRRNAFPCVMSSAGQSSKDALVARGRLKANPASVSSFLLRATSQEALQLFPPEVQPLQLF
jgi:hypothetical protein